MILAILQGRLSSTRLPGKVLAPVLGEPMIVRQLERLSASNEIDALVVATSTDPSDDPLVDELTARGFTVRRGPLNDVVARFAAIVDEFEPSAVVRLTADCPLADVHVIDSVIRAQRTSGSDYASNVLEPTFADGLDVEVVSAGAWARLVALPLTDREREHVTLGLYGRPEEFTLESVTQSPDRSALRWTVDVPGDLEFVRAVYERLYYEDAGFGQQAILDLLARHPELNRTEEDLARNAGLGQ
ncbi:MAG: glycosyltransferase family protein [Actinobacteria bacterium]|nr:glycosyltransferase family protein [Actinomycetota bacterium]